LLSTFLADWHSFFSLFSPSVVEFSWGFAEKLLGLIVDDEFYHVVHRFLGLE
jgi:hypothetical protein